MIEDYDVRPVSRSDGSKVVESEILRRIEGSHLYGQDRIDAQPDGLSHHVIDVALFEEFSGVAVIRHEEEAPGILSASPEGAGPSDFLPSCPPGS